MLGKSSEPWTNFVGISIFDVRWGTCPIMSSASGMFVSTITCICTTFSIVVCLSPSSYLPRSVWKHLIFFINFVNAYCSKLPNSSHCHDRLDSPNGHVGKNKSHDRASTFRSTLKLPFRCGHIRCTTDATIPQSNEQGKQRHPHEREVKAAQPKRIEERQRHPEKEKRGSTTPRKERAPSSFFSPQIKGESCLASLWEELLPFSFWWWWWCLVPPRGPFLVCVGNHAVVCWIRRDGFSFSAFRSHLSALHNKHEHFDVHRRVPSNEVPGRHPVSPFRPQCACWPSQSLDVCRCSLTWRYARQLKSFRLLLRAA